MDALVRRYGRNELSDDESGSPFTNGVLRMPFPERFRMPHIELFKKDTDPKEHVRRGLRLGRRGGNCHMRLLRAWRSPRGIQNQRPDKGARYQRYTNYTPLKKDQEEVLAILEEKNMSKEPPKQSTYARRDTAKYCRFHKENGHETSKCFQLRDHIETLIREGHLKDIIFKKVDRADGQKDSRQDGRARKLSLKKAEDEGAINTIFGGPATGKSNRERTQEIREAMEAQRDLDVNSIEPDPKRIKEGWDPIVFMEADSHGVDVRPNDALVISARIGHREVHRILIDNGSSADILSAEVYDQLRLDRKDLQPFPTPLRGFGGVEVRSLGTVKLPVKIGKAPCQKTVLLDFMVVDTENWPYNALLGRPFLNKTKAVTATYALMMKFPTEYGVGVVKGSQEMARRANLSVYKDRDVRQVYTVTAQQKAGEPEKQAEVPKDFELDPREEPEDRKDEPTQEVALDPEDPSRTVKSHEDMLGVDPKVISHHLSINPEFRPVVQKRRLFNPERSVAIKKEVEKLLSAGSIREVKYPEWVANVVLVKKKNKQWRMCVDFTDLNKACLKDSFPLPRIDQLVDAIAGHELLSFMDAYSGYNQIRMNKADEEKTSFTTDQGLYCYKVMPFRLKNAGATYQRLVNRIFARQIGKEVGKQDIRSADWENHGGLRGRHVDQEHHCRKTHGRFEGNL
ncbi:hypothetical protein LWI29_000931 [Acer saccharum]|uniref:Reverse transcriptase domain-containing protein n=1 Tax=Acer saccharum TaxID=4024 RepID=A0AA39SKN0_ACESA|nr:hypothetical protein LWI29_000931 [Acer saccharum]